MREFTIDTIAAVSTAVSESGIGIIRISGPDSFIIADRVWHSPGGRTHPQDVPTHTIHYGYIKDGDEVIDEVLLSVMRSPRTYTAEDTVEINCHGGILAVRRVLEAVVKAGARPAEPGEFTKRAFLNGRIDLSEAEAVMDVIQAKNDYALKNSISQVRGSVFRKIGELREQMLYQTAHIEAALDDPENLSFDMYRNSLRSDTERWIFEISRLLESADSGRFIREGIRTVIVGKPNAGKSSLLNLLLGEERAIVTEIAGTTRDVLTETVNLQGITLVITDTAGIHDTDDPVEKIGVERAKKSLEEADLLLYLIDASTPLDEDDRQIFELLRGRKSVVLQNKTDLDTVTDISSIRKFLGTGTKQYPERGDSDSNASIQIIPFSATEKTGYDELVCVLKKMFYHGEIDFNDEIVITNTRHKVLLQNALESLNKLRESEENQMPEDFFTIDLMSAYDALGEIIGEQAGEDLVNEIFSRFCMGK